MTNALCPNCRAPLEPKTIEALYGRSVVIDVCTGCQGIWFDEGEVLQLSPHGTLELFKLVHEQPADRRPLGDRLECPRCALRLSLSVDQQRATKFQYHRCARGHGRFITFFHFLRARNFVRTLTAREVTNLRASIKQVNCSNCGAPVDLEKDVACSYCRAPISMLDPDQMRVMLGELQAEDARLNQPDPALPLTLMMERLRVEQVFAEVRAASGRDARRHRAVDGSGLVEAGLGVIMKWLSPG